MRVNDLAMSLGISVAEVLRLAQQRSGKDYDLASRLSGEEVAWIVRAQALAVRGTPAARAKRRSRLFLNAGRVVTSSPSADTKSAGPSVTLPPSADTKSARSSVTSPSSADMKSARPSVTPPPSADMKGARSSVTP